MANYPPLIDVQSAVYSRMAGTPFLTSQSIEAPVVNDDAEDQTYPFILVGAPRVDTWNTFGGTTAGFGWLIVLTVTIFSRYEGDRECAELAEAVIARLNFYQFTVPSYATVICTLDPDGQAFGALKVEYPEKLERRLFPIRFVLMVHE
jgi:hypothetical protein